MPTREFIKQFFDALSWFQKMALSFGSFVLAAIMYTTSLNACVDKHVIRAVEPRLAPLADMVEFSLKRQGAWEEYQGWARQKACDDEIKRGERCDDKGSRPPPAKEQ